MGGLKAVVKVARGLLVGFLAAGLAPAYFHFISYLEPCPPCTPVPRKFDLNSLPDGTVRYFIQASGPEKLAPGDNVEAVFSQIRRAAEVWNSVPGSRLRLAFGGFVSPGTRHSVPVIEVLFDQIPAGLVAMGGPVEYGPVTGPPESPFIPIRRSVLILNKDLSAQHSASEGFFLTLVHELGHALGLQHTLASAVMSTSITRGTTKAMPLTEDDWAGLGLLYPSADFPRETGSVSGQVTLDGAGVHLASVTVFHPGGVAISSLTRPDGSYQVAGVPPGVYYVAVQPLPPPVYGETTPANIVLPVGPDGKPIQPGPRFAGQFFPGVQRLEAAEVIRVGPGEEVRGIDFAVEWRESPAIHSVATYSFPGLVPVKPAFISAASQQRFLVASGVGLTSKDLGTDLEVEVAGGTARITPEGPQPFAPDPRFVRLDLLLNPFSVPGPRHLIFRRARDLYLLPRAFHLAYRLPPAIDGIEEVVTAEGQTALRIRGRNLASTTRVLFDGAEAKTLGASGDELVVRPPLAPAGHRAQVVALNGDGQSSLFLSAPGAVTYEYREPTNAAFFLSRSELAAGLETTLELRAAGPLFSPEETEIGFSSSDVVARRLWVLEPDRLLVTVAVREGAQEQWVDVTVWTGLLRLSHRAALHVVPAGLVGPVVHSPLMDLETGEPYGVVGKPARVAVSDLPPGVALGDVEVLLGGTAIPASSVEGNWVVFRVPAAMEAGLALLSLRVAGAITEPVIVELREPAPQVLAVSHASGEAVSQESPALRGELLHLLVKDLVRTPEALEPEATVIQVNNTVHRPVQVVLVDAEQGVYRVEFILDLTTPVANDNRLRVTYGARQSQPVVLPVGARVWTPAS